MAVWRMSKRKPAALDFPDMPDEYKYIWSWFVRIANSGDVNLQTIESFCRLMNIEMRPFEVEMILEFDLVRRRIESENLKAATPKPVKPRGKR